ncbi:MAG: hypothetical protein FWG56_02335 [Desulfovibrionaceae bacterium]|jgi:acyl-CoA dehydrogenase|nr:hypothetical protein [Desulfovibrionaceae bacterium]
MLELKTFGRLEPGDNPGSVSSILKLRASRNKQAIGELGVEVLGIEGLRWPDRSAESSSDDDALLGTLLPDYLNSRAFTIFGGAAEVQLGIIARTMAGV